MISNITTFKLMNMFYTYVNCIIKSSTKTIIKYTWKVLDEVRLCTSGIFYYITVYVDFTELSIHSASLISLRVDHTIQPFIVKNDVTSVHCAYCCEVQGRKLWPVLVTQSRTLYIAIV